MVPWRYYPNPPPPYGSAMCDRFERVADMKKRPGKGKRYRLKTDSLAKLDLVLTCGMLELRRVGGDSCV